MTADIADAMKEIYRACGAGREDNTAFCRDRREWRIFKQIMNLSSDESAKYGDTKYGDRHRWHFFNGFSNAFSEESCGGEKWDRYKFRQSGLLEVGRASRAKFVSVPIFPAFITSDIHFLLKKCAMPISWHLFPATESTSTEYSLE